MPVRTIVRSVPVTLLFACTSGTLAVVEPPKDPETIPTSPIPTGGFAIDAAVVDAFSGEVPATDLCVDLVDPSPTFLGEAAVVLASAVVGADGEATFADVATESTAGLVLTVASCGGDGAPPSATAVPPEAYAGLGDGDLLAARAFTLGSETWEALQASAASAGHSGDLAADGLLLGFVVDETGAPITGATVTCAACAVTWYLDDQPEDGLFTRGTHPNTATDAAASGAFVIPAGPVGAYLADDGGRNTFGPRLDGSSPGVATISVFRAD